MDYQEHTQTIRVPSNSGVDGFLRTLRDILKLSGVLDINIDARGKVTYRRAVPKTEDGTSQFNIGVDFSGVQPHGVVRNAHVEEVTMYDGVSASVVVGALCDMARTVRLHPTAFVSGANSTFWEWHKASTGLLLRNRDHLYGLPFLSDRLIPDTALLLCAGFGRDSAFKDTRNVYKVEMPSMVVPDSAVEVVP